MSGNAYPIEDAKALLDKWLPKFGFGHYRVKVDCIPKKRQGRYWGRCMWQHEEEAARFEFVPDGVLAIRQLEGVVVHELAHGLASLITDLGGDVEEVVCNRIARLVLGDNLRLANETMMRKHDWNDMPVDQRLVPAVGPLVDALPEQERIAIERRFYEQLSLRDIAKEMNLKHPEDVARLLRRAEERMRTWLESLDVEGEV